MTMFNFGVEVFDHTNAGIVIPPTLTLTPQPWTGAALGGPKTAEVKATGSRAELKNVLLNWLGYRLTITTPTGGPAWWGYVHEVSLTLGGVEVKASLDGLHNRVAVAYTSLEGAVEESLTTAWAENTTSQARYGVCEIVDSLGQASTAMATAYRDRLLSEGAYPQMGQALSGTDEATATLRCRGAYAQVNRRYYLRTDGRLEHTTGDIRIQPIGWGVVASNQVGFGDHAIHDAWGRFTDMAAGMRLTVTGSAGNNKTFTVAAATNEDVESYANNTIYFQPTDDIFDTADGMGLMKSDHWMLVTGSAANSRWHWIGSAGGDHLRTSASISGTIASETTGPTIGLYQAQKVAVVETDATEAPGAATPTITHHGQQVAQRFSPATTMRTDRVMIEASRAGTPTDNLEVRILADSAGAPGALLASGSLAGSLLTDELTAVWVTLASEVTLSAGGYYWIQVRRSGSLSASNYFRLGMTPDAYITCYMWTGSAWAAHAPGWFLRFRLWAVEDTGVLAETLLSATVGAPLTVQTGFVSGIKGFPTMDARAWAGDELERLLAAGSSTGRRVLVDVSPAFALRLYEQPVANVANMPIVRSVGGRVQLYDAAGSPWPAGILPAGLWVELADIDSDLAAIGGLSPAFVDEATYDPRANSWTISFGGKRTLADMLKVQAG